MRHLQISRYLWKSQLLVCLPLGYKVLSQSHHILSSDRPYSRMLHIWWIAWWKSMLYFRILVLLPGSERLPPIAQSKTWTSQGKAFTIATDCCIFFPPIGVLVVRGNTKKSRRHCIGSTEVHYYCCHLLLTWLLICAALDALKFQSRKKIGLCWHGNYTEYSERTENLCPM